MTEVIKTAPRASITSKRHVPLPNQREHLYSGWLWRYSVRMHNRTISGTAVTWAVAMICVEQALTGKR